MATRVIRVGLIIGAVFLLLNIFNVQVIHPKSGLGSAIGSASSTIDLVKKQKSYEINDRVIVKIKGMQPSPWLGRIKAVTRDSYIVDSNKSLITIPKENISGKMLVLLPFLGYLYSLFGI